MANAAKILTMSSNTCTEGTFIVSEISLSPFKDPAKGHFLTFDIRDKTGKVPAKVWNDADEFYNILKTGKIFDIQGKVNQYKGKNQIFVSSIEVSDTKDFTNFLPTSKINPDIMWDELVEILDKNIVDTHMRKLWEVYKNHESFIPLFKMCPGGKGSVHHAYLHGLLEHTLDVTKMCESYCEIYPVDSSIICLGAFLHDHGKIYAYTYETGIEMTDIGRLHGHINLSYSSMIKFLNSVEMPKDKKNYIKKIIGHLILSHHGSLELGSPVKPMTPEAVLLANADITNAETNQCLMFKDKITEGNWTPYDQLKGKFYYKGQ